MVELANKVPVVQPIPFTVIGGFLGAGKTTLVNHILTHSDGVRYALLVNDFGRVNIDEQLVASHDGQTMALSNGCICCSLADGCVKTLLLLMKQIDQFDHIVVETSGVAEPEKIMDVARLDPLLYPEGIIVLADAAEVTDRVVDPQIDVVVRSQLSCASLLLLNKIDTVDALQTERAAELLAELNDKAPVLHCSNADVPLNLLFGLPPQASPAADVAVATPDGESRTQEAVVETNGSMKAQRQGAPGQIPPGQESASPFISHSYSSLRALDRDAFERFRGQLPAAVLRAKGLLRFTDDASDSDKCYLWQRTGKRDELVRWKGQPVTQSQLVFIARSGAAGCDSVAVAAQALFPDAASAESVANRY